MLEDYHVHKHDPIEDSYLNITCENSKEKRKNCTCRKCEIRKKKASGTRKSIHIKEEGLEKYIIKVVMGNCMIQKHLNILENM